MAQPEQRTHSKIFERPRQPKPMRLTQEDVTMLQLLAKYTFLNAEELSWLLGPRDKVIRYPEYREVNGLRGIRVIQHRLELMFKNGYAARPPQQHDALYTQAQVVHALDNAGAEELAKLGVLAREDVNINWQRRSREVGGQHIAHTRMRSRVRMALNLTLPTAQVSFDDQRDWISESRELRLEPYLEGEDPQIPDAFFKLAVSDKKTNNFLLEIQRRNTEKKRFLPRLVNYREGRASYFAQLGVPSFRVLWLAPTTVRRDFMLKVCHDGLNDGKGSNLFFFAAEHNPRVSMDENERYFDIRRPDTLLEKIWKCGFRECEKWHSILD